MHADMRDDHYAMANAFALAVEEVWRVDGEARARQLVDELNEQKGQVLLRWVWFDAPVGAPDGPVIDVENLVKVRGGDGVRSFEDRQGAEARLYTYVPVEAGLRLGALELSESLAPEAAYVRTTILQTIVFMGSIVLLSGLIAMLLGAWFVAQPMRSLIEKARRVGAGDLSRPLTLHQRDEIGDLATEMNAMAQQIAAANARVEAEMSARVATLEQLRHADRLATVGKLASGVAHELGTPLNVVAGRAKMITSGEVEGAEVPDNARIILEQAHRMTDIIRQLLDFTRRRSLKKTEVDVAGVTRQVVSLLRPFATKRNVRIVYDDDTPRATTGGDAAQLQQVLTNLIVNGIQAMPAGGTLSVRLQSTQAAAPSDADGPVRDWVRVDVEDEGEGIPPEVQEHIFEPFFTTKPVGEGTGLGLSVAYGIVNEHGGWIDVRSTVGQGSCFSIHLPRGSA
jgi:two-component system NtrC family sensor kinase